MSKILKLVPNLAAESAWTHEGSRPQVGKKLPVMHHAHLSLRGHLFPRVNLFTILKTSLDIHLESVNCLVKRPT